MLVEFCVGFRIYVFGCYCDGFDFLVVVGVGYIGGIFLEDCWVVVGECYVVVI